MASTVLVLVGVSAAKVVVGVSAAAVASILCCGLLVRSKVSLKGSIYGYIGFKCMVLLPKLCFFW